MSPEQREELLRALKARFKKNSGDPVVVGHDKKTGEYIFYDCSAESPKGRRSVCYDQEGQEVRKAYKPEDNAIE